MFVSPIDGALSEYINHLHRSSGARLAQLPTKVVGLRVELFQLPTKAVFVQLSTDAHHNGIVRHYFTGILG